MSRKAPRYADPGVARCPRCDGVMSARLGRDGPYFHCRCFADTDLRPLPPPGPARETDGRAARLRLYEKPRTPAVPDADGIPILIPIPQPGGKPCST